MQFTVCCEMKPAKFTDKRGPTAEDTGNTRVLKNVTRAVMWLSKTADLEQRI